MGVGGGGEAGRGAEESVGIVGIEVPIIQCAHIHARKNTHTKTRAHARCQSRYINAQ